jgi:CBS domain-containing protein
VPGPVPLGDLVICAPVVAREAREQGKTLQAHWAHMVVHGVLHLRGHDHERAREAAPWSRWRSGSSARLGFGDPYGTRVARGARANVVRLAAAERRTRGPWLKTAVAREREQPGAGSAPASAGGEARDRSELVEDCARPARRSVDADSVAMIEGVLDVADLQVRDIMVPRSQMIVLERDAPIEDLLPVVVESGHSRFPVIGEDRDQVVGILLAKDLLRYFGDGGRTDFDIRELSGRPCSCPRASGSTCC